MYGGTKLALATSLLTGTAVGWYFLNDYLAERIDSKLQGTKVAGTEDWTKKINAVKTKLEALVDDLAKLTTAKELEEWCKYNYNAHLKDENDLRFNNVQSYCIYNNKDKLTKPIGEKEEWTKANQSLKDKAPDTDLSPEMKEIKAKLSAAEKQDNDALKNWCLDYYKQVWKDSKSKDFKEANEYCVTK